MRSHHTSARRLLATACAGALLLSCSSDPDDQLEASVETPEPLTEPSPSEEPSVSPEPGASEAEDPPPLGEDEPRFAPLPELTPDPDNEVPDDLEQIILDAFAEAYDAELGMYAAGELDEEALHKTHIRDGYDSVVAALDHISSKSGRELTPDAEVINAYLVDFQGGAAILRECTAFGPRSGLYDLGGIDLLEPVEADVLARDRMLELTARTGDDAPPRYRVTEIGFAPTDEC